MKTTGMRRVVGRASAASLAVKIGGAGLAFLLQVFLARILGPLGYGSYAFVVTAVGLLLLPAVFGLDTAALRFVAGYRAAGKEAHIRGFALRSLQMVALASGLGAALFALVAWYLGSTIDASLRSALLAGAALIPVLALSKQTGALLQALRHVVLAEAPALLLRPLLFAATAWLAWTLADGALAARSALLIEAGTGALVLALSGLLLWRTLPSPGARPIRTETRRWVSVAFPLFLLSGAHAVTARTDVVLLGILGDTVESGFYMAGSKVAGLGLMGLVAANMIVAPMIAELHSRKAWVDLQRLLSGAARGTFAFGLLVGIGLLVFGPWILDLFGTGFRAAYVPMLVLVVGNLANVAFGSVGYLMTMTGHEREAALTIAGAAVLNVALDVLMIPPFGMTGAAVASALSGVAWNAVLLMRVRRHLNLRPTVFGRPERDEEGRGSR